MNPSILARTGIAVVIIVATLSCRGTSSGQQTFASPDEAAKALIDVAKRGTVDDLMKIFGPEAQPLVDSSEPQVARQKRRVFVVAAAEGWRLDDNGPDGKLLIVGGESWPFPVPLVKAANRWRFDTAAGVEEVLARRIGRNELAVVWICRTYVAAQQLYAERGHDGLAAGRYAKAFRSDAGRENGLFWPRGRGQRRSPLGDLVADAAAEGRTAGRDGSQPSPFHGYFFKILTAQGPAASGGAKDYMAGGDMTGGFALVAWPAQYDSTGVMTFIVNQDGVVREQDLGAATDATAKAMTLYNPDASWTPVQ